LPRFKVYGNINSKAINIGGKIMPEDLPTSKNAAPPEAESPTSSPNALGDSKNQAAPGPTFVSQAVQDLANDQDGPNDFNALKTAPNNPGDQTQRKSLLKSAGWFSLYVLCLLVMAFWAAVSFIHEAPYHWSALVLALATLLVSIPTWRFLSLPTRATMAGLGLTLALTLTSLYNPESEILPGLSFPALWVVTLFLAWLVVFTFVWRKYGREKPGLGILLSFALLYPLLGGALNLFQAIAGFWSGADGPSLTLASVNSSPLQATDKLPAFLWPQAIMAILIPLLASLLAFRTQLSRLLTRKAPFTLAPFYAGLAFLFLLVPSFLAFTPLSQGASLAKNVRGLWGAEFWHSTLPAKGAKAPAATPAAAKTPEPPATAPAIAEGTPAPTTDAPALAEGTPAPTTDAPALAEGAPTPAADAATNAPTDAKDAKVETAPGDPAKTPEPAATEGQDGVKGESPAEPAAAPKTEPAPTATKAAIPLAAPAKDSAPTAAKSEPTSTAAKTEPAPTAAKSDPTKTVEPAAGATPADGDPDASTLLVSPGEASDETLADEEAMSQARSEFIQRLTEENEALEKENDDLSRQNALLKNENELLKERLNFSDQLLHNLTNR
jgi:hypothetical protein